MAIASTSTTRPRRLTHTAEALKSLILARGLRPGDPLPTEAELVELLGVSRSNLREAIRSLVAIDILEVRHGTGTFIGQLSLRPLVNGLAFKGLLLPGDDFATLRQIVEIRTVLDQGLAAGVVERLAGDDAPELYDLCEKMTGAAARGETFTELDREFHLVLASLLGNDLYGQLVAAFWDVHQIVAPRLGLPSARDVAETAAAHRALLDAAIAGDLDRYRAAVHEHYAPLLRVLDASGPTAPAASER